MKIIYIPDTQAMASEEIRRQTYANNLMPQSQESPQIKAFKEELYKHYKKLPDNITEDVAV